MEKKGRNVLSGDEFQNKYQYREIEAKKTAGKIQKKKEKKTSYIMSWNTTNCMY